MKKQRLIILSVLLLLPTFIFSQTPEQMSQLNEYLSKKDTKAVIAFSQKILDSNPDNSTIMCILAWAYAVENNIDLSLTWMEKAINNGYTDYLEFKRDDDFKPIQSHPKFNKLMELGKQQAIKKNEEKAIHLKTNEWNNFELESRYDLPKITMSLSFDHENFYIKALVNDAHFKDGNRAWRYGDGFFINIANPVDFDNVYTNRFYAYGFCLENGTPIAVLVNKDGKYYLGPVQGLTPKIDVDQEKNQANYTITIPWSRLYPFHPLMDNKAGINIRYNSQNDDRSRKRLQYMEDNHFDSEDTKLRRYVPLYFEQSPKSVLHITGKMETRLLSSDHAKVKIATWAPEDLSANISITIKDKDEKNVLETSFTQKLSSGRSLIEREIKLPKPEGFYQLQVSLDKKVRWNDSFFKFDKSALSTLKTGIQQLDKGESNVVLRNSIDALTYRFIELENQIAGFTDRHTPENVQKNLGELNALFETCKQTGSIYTKSGYLISAFKSPLDSTLQPFSIYLPNNFDPTKSYDLLVGLHGSGVTEVGFLRWTARAYADRDFILIGPRGRDLSAWYLGITENDVADLVKLTKKIFNIKKTLVCGFSMGGYGVWRMSFLHPELFDAAICVSGSPSPWRGDSQQNDMRNHIGKGKNLKYLVIHGTDDHAVDIKDTDDFMEKLKAAEYDVEYIRVDGGGHGNFRVKKMVTKWLDEKFQH